jgi:SAM-dependent methyltransferase
MLASTVPPRIGALVSSPPSSTFVAADGDGYEQVMGRWSRRLAEPFLDFVGAAAGERVLDVGCGTGSLAFALAQRCATGAIAGVDFSPVYIAHANARNRDPAITFQVGDACALQFPDKSFDRVLSLLLLHFVPNAGQAIAEMRRVARPGAVVGAAVWDVRGGFIANRLFYDTAAALDARANAARARNYTRPMTRPGELASGWRSAGLTHVVETSLSIRMEFASFDDYWDPYTGQDGPGAAYIMTLSDAERVRLRDAVRLAYLDGEADGPRSYSAMAWAVKGVAPA